MLLSIIIPFYNAESFLANALDSAIPTNQRDDVEIVLIDDGSKDASAKIANQYVEQYPNIKLFQQENGGVSSARNLGISKANGKYIMFLDADDILDNQIYNNILPYLQLSVCDIAFFGVEMTHKRTIEIKNKQIEPISLSKENTIEYFLNKKFLGFNAGKIYKKQLFLNTGITFPIGKVFEDLDVIYRILPHTTSNLWFDATYYYYYLSNENSLTKRISTDDVAVYHEINRNIFKMYTQSNLNINYSTINYYFMDALIFALSELYKLNKKNASVKQHIHTIKQDIKATEKKSNFSAKKYISYTTNTLKYMMYKIGILSILIKLKNKKWR